eukprot:gene1168-biopygen477
MCPAASKCDEGRHNHCDEFRGITQTMVPTFSMDLENRVHNSNEIGQISVTGRHPAERMPGAHRRRAVAALELVEVRGRLRRAAGADDHQRVVLQLGELRETVRALLRGVEVDGDGVALRQARDALLELVE